MVSYKHFRRRPGVRSGRRRFRRAGFHKDEPMMKPDAKSINEAYMIIERRRGIK